jgi:protein involved in temperature-dependent protein secretion
MLYRFRSKAAADVVMLEPVGKRVLELLGKDPAVPGILQVQDMPRAVEVLRAAAVADELAREQRRQAHAALDAEMGEDNLGEATPPAAADPITLRMRVAPFLELLSHSMREHTDVVWGV